MIRPVPLFPSRKNCSLAVHNEKTMALSIGFPTVSRKESPLSKISGSFSGTGGLYVVPAIPTAPVLKTSHSRASSKATHALIPKKSLPWGEPVFLHKGYGPFPGSLEIQDLLDIGHRMPANGDAIHQGFDLRPGNGISFEVPIMENKIGKSLLQPEENKAHILGPEVFGTDDAGRVPRHPQIFDLILCVAHLFPRIEAFLTRFSNAGPRHGAGGWGGRRVRGCPTPVVDWPEGPKSLHDRHFNTMDARIKFAPIETGSMGSDSTGWERTAWGGSPSGHGRKR